MKAITWSTVAIAAAVITAAIFVYALFEPANERDFKASSILWIYAGSFSALAVTWGIVEILLSDGYGTGDIF